VPFCYRQEWRLMASPSSSQSPPVSVMAVNASCLNHDTPFLHIILIQICSIVYRINPTVLAHSRQSPSSTWLDTPDLLACTDVQISSAVAMLDVAPLPLLFLAGMARAALHVDFDSTGEPAQFMIMIHLMRNRAYQRALSTS